VPSYRIVRVSDELHYAELCIHAPHPLAQRIGYEFLSMMWDGQPPKESRDVAGDRARREHRSTT